MAKLVIGNNKTVGVPAIVRDLSPEYYIEVVTDANGKAIHGSHLMDFSKFTDVGPYVFANAYINDKNLTGEIDMSSMTTLSSDAACNQMFLGCVGLTSVNLSSLTTISGPSACSSMFSACSGLTNVDLSSLTTISGPGACATMFSSCALRTVDLGSLTTISGSNSCSTMFNSCKLLSSVNFDSLTTISGTYAFQNAFLNCKALTELRFPALKTVANENVFSNMLGNTKDCIVHFPSNFATTVTASKLGGTNTTVLYDLPATE